MEESGMVTVQRGRVQFGSRTVSVLVHRSPGSATLLIETFRENRPGATETLVCAYHETPEMNLVLERTETRITRPALRAAEAFQRAGLALSRHHAALCDAGDKT